MHVHQERLGAAPLEEASDAARQRGFGFAIAGSVAMAVRQMFVEAGAADHLPALRPGWWRQPTDTSLLEELLEHLSPDSRYRLS
ncbi:MAG TPA: hypothetical protein VFY36_11755 [Solirubrobacteraceae bacterium]|nr:hypothetical protein [Solirubrobacteraceae bacterium]